MILVAHLNWRKSTCSGQEQSCVEVANSVGSTVVRDTKLGDASPVLVFPAASWQAFLVTLRS
ncbi:DUF397 domain-containing protein [Fodinicola feengrottensis]|uniref:DUF397 domain-containing protein n=1 Tax=Fodinicola feengrottensis TaxID=435914 RepID=UPI0013D85D86|nr:DUF397 domain-containing protein [Fodinicola feengrottensis]